MKEETKRRITAILSLEESFDMALFAPLSEACAGELSRRLRAGADPETECPEAYALALSLLMRSQALDNRSDVLSGSFTVGDVSISGLEAQEESAALRQRAYHLLSGYLQPASFAFRGVRA